MVTRKASQCCWLKTQMPTNPITQDCCRCMLLPNLDTMSKLRYYNLYGIIIVENMGKMKHLYSDTKFVVIM